jgi:16S rRNA (cytosine967-C5)-methyltransferase
VLAREVEKRGGYDAVLVDAPCSASGTWRRNPDARNRYPEVGELPALQGKLLACAAQAVRPGGRLAYATCSFRVEENEDVVRGFLAANPAFTLVQQGMHGCPERDADAMFVALLTRAL